MKLLQAKLRGTGPLLSSNWFQLSSGLNQFHFENRSAGTLFLRSLQTLSPLFTCSIEDPFNPLPCFEKRGNYQRHIQPSKRTIALGVFAATADIVQELGVLDQNLYETDRVEIGRRLDYSRWLNFVELSSSTRWKEVKTSIHQLFELLPQQGDLRNEAEQFAEPLGPTDRVKGSVSERLLVFLGHLEATTKELDIYSETVELIRRHDHFQTARKIVFKRLPLLIYFNPNGDISPLASTAQHLEKGDHAELLEYMKATTKEISSPSTDTTLERIISGIELAITASAELSRMQPIFLFDTPEANTPMSEHDALRQAILSTAENHQCCYLSCKKDFFTPDVTGGNYSDSDLQLTPYP